MKFGAALCAALMSNSAVSKPLGVHVAISGADGMVVSWSQNTPLQSGAPPPQVKYGLSKDDLSLMNVDGQMKSYLTGATVHCHATLRPLAASTTYYYSIFDADEGAWAEPLEFATVAGPESRSLIFAVYGDLGEEEKRHNGNSTIEWLGSVDNHLDLIWHVGDVGYADDSFLHEGCEEVSCYEEVWDDYLVEMQASAGVSRTPWMTTPGNHEVKCFFRNSNAGTCRCLLFRCIVNNRE